VVLFYIYKIFYVVNDTSLTELIIFLKNKIGRRTKNKYSWYL